MGIRFLRHWHVTPDTRPQRADWYLIGGRLRAVFWRQDLRPVLERLADPAGSWTR